MVRPEGLFFVYLPSAHNELYDLVIPNTACSLVVGPTQNSLNLHDDDFTKVSFLSHSIPFLPSPPFRNSQKQRTLKYNNEVHNIGREEHYI